MASPCPRMSVQTMAPPSRFKNDRRRRRRHREGEAAKASFHGATAYLGGGRGGPQRDPSPEPAADEREPPGVRREQAPPQPLRPVPDRAVGPARALRRRHDPDGHAPRARGPFHAQGGL